MTGKTALRAVWQAEITLDRRPGAGGEPAAELPTRFRDVAQVLTATRYTRRLAARSAARTAAYELALAYAQQREQFGQPIAGFQLVQDKLARMLGRDHLDAADVPAALSELAGRRRG